MLSICQIGGVAVIRVLILWRDIAIIEDEIELCCGDVNFLIILNLMPVILITAVPLQVLWTLLVVEDKTPDLFLDISVTELRLDCMTVHRYCVVRVSIYVKSYRCSTPHTAGGGLWNHQGNRGGSNTHTVGG